MRLSGIHSSARLTASKCSLSNSWAYGINAPSKSPRRQGRALSRNAPLCPYALRIRADCIDDRCRNDTISVFYNYPILAAHRLPFDNGTCYRWCSRCKCNCAASHHECIRVVSPGRCHYWPWQSYSGTIPAGCRQSDQCEVLLRNIHDRNYTSTDHFAESRIRVRP
jgi:hypothetical protein